MAFDLRTATVSNNFYRNVIITAKNSQLVLMSISAGQEIGLEKHEVDQLIYIETGAGLAELDGESSLLYSGTALFIPAGTNHNVKNTGTEDLKLFTIYSPPEHEAYVTQKVKL